MITNETTHDPASPNRFPQPGETFGRYRVLELLGQGGMGQIFRVRVSDQPDSAAVALKVIDTDRLSRTERLRFEREFELASRFRHPNLIEVYEFGSLHGVSYYTMEWVKGVDIDRAFGRERKMLGGGELPAAVVGWIDGVLSGLATLHDAGIVHRDLKPENILIDSNGVVKILDLGLASNLVPEQSMSRLTMPGVVLGTIHYMAPEQVIGADVGPRSDLYSLGVILYRWFSGKLPFDGPDPISVLGQILHEPPPLLELSMRVPQAAVELVGLLLKKNPEERPTSATEVRALWGQAFGQLSDSVERELVTPSLRALPLPPRFVGRNADMERAQNRLLDETANQGLAVVVRGSAGLGKTRFVTMLGDWAKRRRWKVLSAAASSLDTLPFQPLLEPMRASLSFGVPECLEAFRSDLAILLPELSLNDIPAETEYSPMRRYRLFEGMRRLLLYDRRKAEDPVTFVVLEGLQYAGSETLEFLHFLRQRQDSSQGARLLVVATFGIEEGSGELREPLDQILREPDRMFVDLGPLDRTCAKDLVLSMLGGGDLDEVSLRALYEQSEGNPLFLIEITRIFLDEGRLERLTREGGVVWKLNLPNLSRSSSSTVAVPDTLKEVVGRRLRPLSPEDRKLLKKAAFLGLRFPFALLAPLVGQPEREVFDALVDLTERGLVRAGKADGVFDFCNSVLPAVLLDSVSPEEKRLTHLEICRVAIGQGAASYDPFWLAWHYREAGEGSKALLYLKESADRALRSFSFAQACALGRELLASGEELAALGIPKDVVEEQYADALRCRGDLGQAQELYQELFHARSATNDFVRLRLRRKLSLVADAQGDSRRAFELLRQLWRELGLSPLEGTQGSASLLDLLKALSRRHWPSRAMGRVEALTPPQIAELMPAATELQRLLFFLRPPGWVQQAIQVAVVQRQVSRGTLKGPLDAALAQFHGAYLCLRLPRGWQAHTLKRIEAAVALLHDTPSSFQAIDLKRDLAYLYHLAGLPERGLDLIRDVLVDAERLGHLTTLPTAYGIAAAAMISMAEFEQARDYAWKGYHLAQAVNHRRDEVLTGCELLRSLIYLKRWDELDPLYQELGQESFQMFPYLRLLWTQARVEREIWEGLPQGLERAENLALEGLSLCVDLDELRYHRSSFHLLWLESRLKQVGKDAATDSDWRHYETKVRPFPHLRFRVKLMKMMWLLDLGSGDEARLLAQQLLERPECNRFRRALIKELLAGG